ncbi:MAG TPA: hypothetical protein VF268_07290 [Gammaproteobacteria bacterium]
MQCAEVRIRVEQAIESDAKAFDGSVRDHLARCGSCRHHAEDVWLRRLLKDLPVPPPAEGFAGRALDNAWTAKAGREAPQRPGHGRWLASAAALLLAVGVLLKAPWQSLEPALIGTPMQVVQVAPQSVRQVELLMVSGKPLPEAYITVQLDEHVGLAGYPGISRVRWQAPISAGNNQLSLPVLLLGEHGGVIVVEVESGGARKRMTFAVESVTEEKQALLTI